MNSNTNTTPRFIDLYYEWCKAGELPADGLCGSIPYPLIDSEIYELLLPTEEDIDELEVDGLCTTFWASEGEDDETYNDLAHRLNPLRQTIILFCAAINGEL